TVSVTFAASVTDSFASAVPSASIVSLSVSKRTGSTVTTGTSCAPNPPAAAPGADVADPSRAARYQTPPPAARARISKRKYFIVSSAVAAGYTPRDYAMGSTRHSGAPGCSDPSFFLKRSRHRGRMAAAAGRRYHSSMSLIATRLSPAFDAVVSIKARIPDDAMSAGLLGTERSGHGVRIRDDGLIATIGYIVNEADTIWIGSRDGTIVPGVAIGYDFESGLGLVRPTLPLPGATIEIGSAEALAVGDDVLVVGSDAHDEGLAAEVVA